MAHIHFFFQYHIIMYMVGGTHFNPLLLHNF
nr:MAG TPA: hypothetical protein [Crassvirales sp.]